MKQIITIFFLVIVYAQSFSALSFIQLDNQESQFLPVDSAFIFNYQQVANELIISWDIKAGYYLYGHGFKFSSQQATLGKPQIPVGKNYTDEYFGNVIIYEQQVVIKVPLIKAFKDSILTVAYQGCAVAGFCYPVNSKIVYLDPVMTNNQPSNSLTDAKLATATAKDTHTKDKFTASIDTKSQFSLAQQLTKGSLWMSLLLFFALGIGLAFTPCVFPMYPILSSIIIGQSKLLSTKRAFSLSLTYVQGIALTYTLLGLVVASLGSQYQAALQHPAILIILSVLFILLALAMFGLYDINLPSSWRSKLIKLTDKQQGGGYVGVLAMGALSGLIASPCVTAPLAGALLYVTKTGDLLLGGGALYVMSLGMGVPLLILGSSGGKLLPQAGRWMHLIKIILGFLLLSVAIFLLERLLSITWATLLWGLFAISFFGYLYYKNQQSQLTVIHGIRQIILLVALISTVIVLYDHLWNRHPTQKYVFFIEVQTIDDVRDQLKLAEKQNKLVMLDFYANWCIACKDFEFKTFTDARVQEKFTQMILLRADVSQNSKEDIALLNRFNVPGLPTLIFFDQGKEISGSRVTGYLNADDFVSRLANFNLKKIRLF